MWPNKTLLQLEHFFFVSALATIYTSGFGITAGAHRLWSHRAYKAKWPLRLLLVFLFTITGQVFVPFSESAINKAEKRY